jgi:L-lactate dehydrogenase (cytochrome)
LLSPWAFEREIIEIECSDHPLARFWAYLLQFVAENYEFATHSQFCLKGIMSAADARRAVEIGCTGIIVSNHGGRQLDGSRASFDQLAEIVDAVGDRIDVLMDGGVRRGSHVLKALSVGAKAVGVGRYYLFPLAAAGQAGVERALGLMRTEIERDMKLMGCTAISQLSRDNLRFRSGL